MPLNNTKHSQELFYEAQHYLPGGVDSPVRAFKAVGGIPPFIARGEGIPQAADDAAEIGIFRQDELPGDLAFDHPQILNDYFSAKRCKRDP